MVQHLFKVIVILFFLSINDYVFADKTRSFTTVPRKYTVSEWSSSQRRNTVFPRNNYYLDRHAYPQINSPRNNPYSKQNWGYRYYP